MGSDYVARSGAGGLGSANIINDDEWLLEIEDPVDPEDKTIAKEKDPRSY